jgi:hypothetical protein
MRKLLALLVGLMITGGVLLAQDHSNTTERRASARITFTTDTRVGGTILKADDYAVSCDKDKVTFVRVSDQKKVLEVRCKGTELNAKQQDSQTSTTAGKDGVRVLDSLIIEGSNIKHTFD